MSVIKVWAKGRWSKRIHGLDKVYFIKKALLSQYAPEECFEYCGDYENLMNGFEINGIPISVSDFSAGDYKSDFWGEDYKCLDWSLFWGSFTRSLNVQLENVEIFTLPIVVLRQMSSEDPYLSAKYDEIISASKAPEPTPRGYSILLKFENE